MNTEAILKLIEGMIADLRDREREGFRKQVVGECVYNVAVGNQGAYCVLKDLQETILTGIALAQIPSHPDIQE